MKYTGSCHCGDVAYGKVAAISVRSLEDFDLAGIKRKPVDGKSF